MKQPLNVELLYGGFWQDHSDNVYTRDDVVISRGRGDEQSEITPSRLSFTFDNRDGTFHLRNPASSLFDRVDRNTPIRVYFGTKHDDASNFDLNDTTSHVASSVAASTDDAMLLCAWGAPDPTNTYTVPVSMTAGATSQGSNGTVASAYEAISSTGQTGTRTATYGASEDYVSASVVVHGTSPTVESSTAFSTTPSSPISVTAGWWIILMSYMGWDDGNELMPDYPYDDDGGGWIQLSDTGPLAPGDADADFIQMKCWGKRVRTTGTITPIVDTASVNRTIAFAVSGVTDWDVRFVGDATSWNLRRSINGDSWTEIEAFGALRRIGQGNKQVRSVIYREVTEDLSAPALVGYWPCEDGTDARRLGAASPNTKSMVFDFAEVNLATYTGFNGSEALPTVTTAVGRRVATASVPPYPDGETRYQGLFAIPAGGITDNSFLVKFFCTEIDHLTVLYRTANGGSLELSAFDDEGVLVDSTAVIDFDLDDSQFLLSLQLVQNGANLDLTIFVRKIFDDSTELTSQSDTLIGVTLGRVRYFHDCGEGTDGVTFGHQIIASTSFVIGDLEETLTGWKGELAGRRFLRLCKEESIQAAVIGDPDDTMPMGVQAVGSLLDLFAEIERTDNALIGDAPAFNGLVMRTGRSRYNQNAALTLDYDLGQVAPPLDPITDDYLTRNDVVATRTEGSKARAVDQDGPLGVDTIGRTRTEIEVNPYSDSVLPNHAQWYLHLGTLNETRYPQVSVDLDASTSLADTAGSVDVGDRIVLTSLPVDLTPDDANLMTLGYTEVIGSHRRMITFNTSPETPYHILENDHDDYSFIGSDGSTLNSVFTSGTSTSMSVAIAAGYPLWDDTDAPFDLNVSGARLTVTAISGTTSPQTFTITQTPVNGVEKTIAAGTTVDVFHKSYLGL